MRSDAYAICPEPPTGVTDKVAVAEAEGVTEGVTVIVGSLPTDPVTTGIRVFVGRNVAVGGTTVEVEVVVRVCVGSGDGVMEGVTVLVGARNGIAARKFAGKMPGAKKGTLPNSNKNNMNTKRVNAKRRLRSRSFCLV